MTPILRAQRQRGAFLRDHLRKLGDIAYDTDAALLKRWNPFFPRFNGHSVGQQSLEYALLLLFSDDRTYGTDDAGEANRILRKILEYQDLRPGSDTFGNFFWMTHWDRVKDRNAVSFLCSGLVYAYQRFPEKLTEDTRNALKQAFPNVLQGIRNHKVRWQYTNIFFLNLGGLVGLSRVLGDESAHKEAVADFDAWLEGTAQDGFHEFNSPTYTPVTLFGIEAAWANTPDDAFRKRLERIMDMMTYQMALNISPSGFLGGAAARAYQNDAIYGTGGSAIYAHLKFGTPCPPLGEMGSTLNIKNSLFDYVPPEAARNLAHEKPAYTEIHDRGVSMSSRRTHTITPAYSLASQSIAKVGGHSPPSYVLLVRNADSPRKSVPILPDESFTHQPCASFVSRQTGAQIIGRLRYELPENQRQRFLDDPTFICEPRALFGLRPDIREVRIGNVDWGGQPIHLHPGQSIAVAYDDLHLGLIAAPADSARRLRLAYGDDDELRLHIHIYGGPDLKPEDNPADVLLFVEVRPSTGALADYADELSRWRLSASGDAFSAERADGNRIAYPYADNDPDPLGDALHASPDLALRPGDLIGLINGDIPLPFQQ